MRELPICAKWVYYRVQKLATCCMVKTYPKNTVIYSTGDEPQTIYIVKEGEVELSLDVSIDAEHRWPIGIREWQV